MIIREEAGVLVRSVLHELRVPVYEPLLRVEGVATLVRHLGVPMELPNSTQPGAWLCNAETSGQIRRRRSVRNANILIEDAHAPESP